MKRLKALRTAAGLSQRGVSRKCNPPVDQAYICYAENGLALGRGQAQRLADALGWDGDPMALFDDVEVANHA